MKNLPAKYHGVLRIIESQGGELATGEIADRFSESKRSVRRWLGDMVEKGVIRKNIDSNGTPLFRLSCADTHGQTPDTSDRTPDRDGQTGADTHGQTPDTSDRSESCNGRAHPSSGNKLPSSDPSNKNHNCARDSKAQKSDYDPLEAAKSEINSSESVYKNRDWSDLEDIEKIEEHLRSCGFKANTQTANKIYRAAFTNSDIANDEILQFAIVHINQLSGKVESGEWSRSKAQRCLGNQMGLNIYLDNEKSKATKGESKGYKTDVGKNDFDAPEADIETPESNEADDPFPDKSDLELVQTAIEINEDPEQFRPGVLDRIDWAEIDDSLDVPDHLHKRGA